MFTQINHGTQPDLMWTTCMLEAHLDRHMVSEEARRGCQYHCWGVLIRTGAGWYLTDVEPLDAPRFVPSGAAIAEASSRAVRELKGFTAQSSTASTETAKPSDRNRQPAATPG
jgi:hypothetical protein